jgi:hypothetical protein
MMKRRELTVLKSSLEGLMGEELSFVCAVKDFTHRKNKRGDGFGVLSVEDASDEHIFYFFSELYMEMKDMDVVGQRVLIDGVVEKQRYGFNAEFNVRKMEVV